MSLTQVVLGMDASLSLEIKKLDVKTTFLHGDLEEEIYLEQHEKFKVQGKEGLVCKLKKSLHGFKQTLKQWYIKFDSFIEAHGYSKTTFDHCVFVKKLFNDDFIILLLYVDGMLIVGHDTSKIEKLKNDFNKSFTMKDLGLTN